ncbi:MAG: hypothetical protein R6X25_05145 [Candidatus Krumholzibacteriia bacterium]
MARDDTRDTGGGRHPDERLEAYLDGELDHAARAAFDAELDADPALRAALAGRRAFRETTRRALGDAQAVDLEALVCRPTASRKSDRFPHGSWRHAWPALALAAGIALVALVPPLLRNDPGAEGPRSPITRAGQVVAVRFGEVPGGTVVLRAGVYDERTGEVH